VRHLACIISAHIHATMANRFSRFASQICETERCDATMNCRSVADLFCRKCVSRLIAVTLFPARSSVFPFPSPSFCLTLPPPPHPRNALTLQRGIDWPILHTCAATFSWSREGPYFFFPSSPFSPFSFFLRLQRDPPHRHRYFFPCIITSVRFPLFFHLSPFFRLLLLFFICSSCYCSCYYLPTVFVGQICFVISLNFIARLYAPCSQSYDPINGITRQTNLTSILPETETIFSFSLRSFKFRACASTGYLDIYYVEPLCALGTLSLSLSLSLDS